MAIQYSCLEDPMNRGALVGYCPQVAGSDTTEAIYEQQETVSEVVDLLMSTVCLCSRSLI